MLKFLKQLFCNHNFIDKCKVKTYNGIDYKNLCQSFQHNKCCHWHNEAYEILDGYCDYHYFECSKCGKVRV